MRLLVITLLTASLVAAVSTGAVLTLFTTPVFAALEFHPVALDYIYGRMSREEMRAFTAFGILFTEAEIVHFDDVRTLLTWLSRIFLTSVVVCVLAMWMASRLLTRAGQVALAVLTIAIALTVAAYAIFGFEAVGVVFHEVVFPQGNWRFPYESLIIRLYGTDVMLRGAAFVFVLGFGGLAVLTGILWATSRLLKPPPAAR